MRAHRTATADRPHALVRLVSRLLVAQAAASAAIGFAYDRRNLPWLVVTVTITIAVCALAVLVRPGGHAIWLTAVAAESVLVAAGLVMFASVSYLGGTLLAIGSLSTLLHPATARAFDTGSAEVGPVGSQPAIAESAADLQASAAGS
jgi:hypothetical protein